MKVSSISLKLITLLLFLNILAIGTQAQVKWEEGYFVKNDGSIVNCLIKNKEWKYNPVSFDYKFPGSDKANSATIEEVERFVIGNELKYIRKTVMIDMSGDQVGQLSTDAKPEFNKQTVFLKVLVEGAANLFKYESGNLRRFFYSIGDTIEPLIYKRYTSNGDKIRPNNMYQQQLWKNIKCGDLHMTEVLQLPYKEKELINFFTEYSKCKNSSYTIYDLDGGKRTYIYLKVGSGLSQLTASINDRSRVNEHKLHANIFYSLGAELEHYLPFNNRKWSIFLSPSITYFKATGEYVSLSNTFHEASVNNLSLDAITGFRHSLYISDLHQIFLSAGFHAYYPLNGLFDLDGIGEFPLSFANSFILGAGFRFNDLYSIDVNYNFLRNMTRPDAYDLYYSHIGIQIGYTLTNF